jgi:hypothetical protein
MRAVFFAKYYLVTVLALGLAACAPAAEAALPLPAVQTQIITPSPTSPLETSSPEPTKPAQLSFSAATYQDESAGYELDYPAEWAVQPRKVIGERGSQALLLSPGTTPETLAEGGSRIAMVVYLWDPKKDLTAFATQRKTAWSASGSSILSESTWELADGREAVNFVVQAPDEGKTFILLTTAGEEYLQIGGEGNLALIEEIAGTLRPLQARP